MVKVLYKCKLLVLLVLLVIICGCAEPVSNPEVIPKEKKPRTELTDYLPFVINTYSKGVNTAAAYSFVDANNPSSDLEVINHTDGIATILPVKFFDGIPDNSNGGQSVVIKGNRLGSFLYEKKGRIYKIDVSNVLYPEGVQLSTEDRAMNICHDWDRWADDYVNPLESRYIYYVSNDCNSASGVWRMISLGTAAEESPATLPANIDYLVTHIHDQQTGALVGWLAVEKSNGISKLVRYDQNFRNGQSINLQIAAASDIKLLGFAPDGKLLLTNHNQLVSFNDAVGSRTIVESKVIFPAEEQKKISYIYFAGDYLYFTVKDETNVSTSLNRVLLTGTLDSFSEMTSVIGNINKIETSGNNLLFAHNGQISRIKLDSQQIEKLNFPSGYVLGEDENKTNIFYAISDFLFIELMSANDFTKRIVWVMNDLQRIDDLLYEHYLVGVIFEDELNYSSNTKVNSLLFETGGVNSGNRNVHVLHPENYPVMKMLGTLPNSSNEKMLRRYFASGHQQGLLEGNVDSLKEIFYFDARKENSLKRITNNNVNESVINH